MIKKYPAMIFLFLFVPFLVLGQSGSAPVIKISAWRSAVIAGSSQNFSLNGVMGEFISGSMSGSSHQVVFGTSHGFGIFTDVQENDFNIPRTTELMQNFPNPFNPATQINYSLHKPGNVNLTVYNVIGKEVAVIVNEFQSPGSYTVSFNGSNLASGVYIYRLTTDDFSSNKKLVLLK